MESLWAWIVLLGAWCIGILAWCIGILAIGSLFDGKVEWLTWVVFFAFLTLMLLILAAAVLGSIRFLEYNQAWPFTPE